MDMDTSKLSFNDEVLQFLQKGLANSRYDPLPDVVDYLHTRKARPDQYLQCLLGQPYDAKCVTILGYFYYNGIGIDKDESAAFANYQIAGVLGNPIAQHTLGNFYYNGIKQLEHGHEKKAFRWYKKAAFGGNPTSQRLLATFYQRGFSTREDKSKAFYWLRKAANGGDASSRFHLGMAYYSGDGTSKDVHEAIRWVRKSDESGSSFVRALMFFFQKNSWY